MRILTINACDSGGGAASLSYAQHKFNYARDPGSRMFVGKKLTRDTTVQVLPRSFWNKVHSYLMADDFSFFDTSFFDANQIIGKFDLIHLHNAHGWYLNLPAVLSLSWKIPLIWTLHDMWSVLGGGAHTTSNILCDGLYLGSNRANYPKTLWDNSKALRQKKTDLYETNNFRIVTPNSWLAEKIGNTSLARQKTTIIRNGISDLFINLEAAHKAKNLSKNVVMIGDNVDKNDYKGFRYFKSVANNCTIPNINYFAIGGNSFRDLGHLKILKRMDHVKLSQFLKQCDLLILCSEFETEPLVVLEALASGLSVVSFDVGGVSGLATEFHGVKIVKEKTTSSLLSAIEIALIERDQPKFMDSQIQNIKKIQDKFTVNSMCKSYYDFFASAVNGG